MVGSGTAFLSGVSYYTHRLATALAEDADVSVILMRRLIPTRLYPGRMRVGDELASFRYPAEVPVFDGVDWWGRGLAGAVAFLRRRRPDYLVLQWWTGAVLHSYLVLAAAARVAGARVVIEFHESQDVGEMAVAGARSYVDAAFPLLLRLAGGAVVHTAFDADLVTKRYRLDGKPVVVAAHGPYDGTTRPDRRILAQRPPGARELLWFGVIRPFKGLEDLIAAFDSLDDSAAEGLNLTVVGETWEGWTLPLEEARRSRRAAHIAIDNRYVTDEELAAYLARAHAVVLPYRRSSSSGPLAMAMAHGLPVVVTAVGGLVEAARDYRGAHFVAPGDVAGLREAIRDVAGQPAGPRHASPASWVDTRARYRELFARLPGR